MPITIDERFKPFLADLEAAGLRNYMFDTEMWFYEDGVKIIQKRAGLPERVDDAHPDEIRFAAIADKHFPRNKV